MKEQLTIKALYKELEHTRARTLLEKVEYPWEVLPEISDFILTLGPTLPKDLFEEVGENIWIAKSATVSPLATITGPTIIGENSQVRPGAFIRGSALVGDTCVVGNSTELKNCILFDNVQVPHYNYVGDSILGFHAHMGAGAVTSNIKADRKNIVIRVGDESIETGRRKVGAMLGDYADIGCNSVLNPGSIVGAHTNVYPLSFVRGFIPANSIVKTGGKVVKKEER
ncbi:MAG: UDP-N-acetylglucosamine pyrophosphorylase [Clostridia bacterium]|nr:UDP-N-acetylglucosamine pyrophosphorylase [Clostridia bacterium]